MTVVPHPETIQRHSHDRAKLLVRLPYKFITKMYVFIFGRPTLQLVNQKVLQIALRAGGYANTGNVISAGEVHFLKLLAKHNPRLCIDVGANKGRYSAALLETTEAKIIAFEPLPGAYRRLVALSRKYPGRVSAINKGVGDKSIVLDLYYGDEDSELASFSAEVKNVTYVGASNKHSVRIPVVTLDEYFSTDKQSILNEGIDLIKIDTEGYEYNVLLGAQKLIATIKPKFIQIEYNWHQLFQHHSLYSLSLLLNEYIVYRLLPHGSGLLKIDPLKPESNIYHYSNFVFVRNDVVI